MPRKETKEAIFADLNKKWARGAGEGLLSGPVADAMVLAPTAPAVTDAAAPRRHPRPAAPRRRTAAPAALAPCRTCYLLAPLALLVVFTYIPVAEHVLLQLHATGTGSARTRSSSASTTTSRSFTRPELFGVFVVSLYYLGASVVQIVLALYFATVLSFNVRFRNLFKGILFFPYLINGVAIGFIFLYFFQPGGTLDAMLRPARPRRACPSSGSATRTSSTSRWPARRSGASWA